MRRSRTRHLGDRLPVEPAIRLFSILAAGTLVLFILIGLGSMAQSRVSGASLSSMKGLTSSLSSKFFIDMVAMELPELKSADDEASTFSQGNVFNFAMRFLTGVNPDDPKTFLAGAMPTIGSEKTVLFRAGTGQDKHVPPMDYMPSQDILDEEGGRQPDASEDPEPSVTPEPTPTLPDDTDVDVAAGEKKPKIFIYHSHNRESFLPELEGVTDISKAFDKTTNITLVGKRMAQKLQDLGIGAVASEKDYNTAVKDFNYTFSYKYSLQTVKEAFAANPELEYFIDIHRDGQTREHTTTEINGVSYAQLFFIIGYKNDRWQQNEKLANDVHQRLEKEYPGISRGVWGKDSGNAEYNQSFSPNSILIEIGGAENTLEETYRTADLVAEMLADVIWDAERVDGPAAEAGAASS